MFCAEVINPDDRKRRIKCSSCGISYTAGDYKILYENKKIVYFKYKNKIYCHECLYKILSDYAQGKRITFIIKMDGHEFKCKLEQNKSFDEGESPFTDLF